MAKKKLAEAHGGAWKVAYADFVTAMMALFMVLWISSQQKEILIATSKYFQNPFTSPMPASSGVMDGKRDTVKAESGKPSTLFTPEMYAQLAKEFLKLLEAPEKKGPGHPIEIKVVPDGILITLFNHSNQPIFEPGSVKLTEWGNYVSQNLAWIIDRFHMNLRIDAHAPKDAKPLDGEGDLWDLTADQANVMRRELVHYGLDASKVDRVSGFGDTHPMENHPAEDPENYRLEMTLMATANTPAAGGRKLN